MFKKILFFFAVLNVVAVNAQISDALYQIMPNDFKPFDPKKPSHKDKRNILFAAHAILWNSDQPFEKEFERIANELSSEAKITSDKSIKVLNYCALVKYYNYAMDRSFTNDLGRKYSDLLISSAEGDTAFYKELAVGYLHRGTYDLNETNFEEATLNFQKALELSIMAKDTTGISHAHSNFNQLYSSLYLFQKAIDEQKLMLSYKTAAEVAKGYSNFFEKENYQDRAYTYLSWYQREPNPALMDSAWNYIHKIPAKVNRVEYFKSYTFFLKGLARYQTKDYKQAVADIDSSLSINDFYTEANDEKLVYRALCYLKLGQKAEAHKVLLNTQNLKISLDLKKNINKVLYQEAADNKEYKDAVGYFELFTAYEDSISIVSQRGQVISLMQTYALKEKENKIVNLELENEIAQSEKKSMALAFVLIGIFLVAVIIVLFTVNRDRKLKAIQANAELNREKQNVEDMLRLQEREIQRVRKKSLLNLRRQISRDLHDGISSSLTGLKYYVNDLRNNTEEREKKDLLSNIEQEVDSVYLQARSYMHNLHTGIDEAVGNLNPFLRNIFHDFSRKNNIDIKFHYNKEEIEARLSLMQQNQLTLMLKEAMSNILKHADASAVEVSISFDAQQCNFSISDNGRGFSKKPRDKGMGMESIQQRIKRIKGTVFVNSSSQGTRLFGSFPLNQ